MRNGRVPDQPSTPPMRRHRPMVMATSFEKTALNEFDAGSACFEL